MAKVTYDVTSETLESYTSFENLVKLLGSITTIQDTQQARIHKACTIALIEWFKKENPNWIGTVVQSLKPSGGSLRVEAVIFWFQQMGGVTITVGKEGKVSVSKDKKWKGKRDADKLQEAKINPFFKIAPPEKPITMPELSYKTIAAMLNRREFLGEHPNWAEIMDGMKKEYEAAKSSKGFKAWKNKAKVALAEGDLEYIHAPETEETEPVTEVKEAA